jgi:hypothetical protein
VAGTDGKTLPIDRHTTGVLMYRHRAAGLADGLAAGDDLAARRQIRRA